MTISNSNLDLTKVSSEDTDRLVSKIETFYKADSNVKTQLSWNWERNHLMLDGKQWIVYDGDQDSGGIWKKLRVSKQNEYIPRPVTNYIFDSYQTLKSYLLKSKPRSTVRPNTQMYQDKMSAKIADLILETHYEKLKESYNYEYAAANLLTYGTVFKKSYWDTSVLSMAKVPRMLQTMNPMTGMPEEVQDKDPETGEELFDELPLGDVSTCVVEPYRMAIDPLATDLHNARWLMEYGIQSLDWIQDTYGKFEEGYTGRAQEVKEERNLSGSMRRFHNLKTSSGVKSSGSRSGGGVGADEMVENAAVVKEYYERPTKNYPKGRLIVVASGIPLYIGEPLNSGPDQGDWHPYSECRWELVPGRFWGKSPLDPAVEIQKQINSIDSVIILTRKTMAIPQKLLPQNSGVPVGSWTGRPGQEVRYRNDGSGMKPETIAAAGVDSQVFREREQRLEDLKQITGGIDILKGDKPPGVTAASALNLLYEVGTGKLFPILNRWKDFVESDQKKQLRLVARHYQEPRKSFINMLKAKNKEISAEALDNFIGSDLHDNCNVIVEAGSNIPKLQAAQQSLLMELAQTGVLSLEIPENKMKFLERLGVRDFANEISPDMKRAEWENDLLAGIKDSPDNAQAAMVMDFDDHELHNEVHKRFMKEPAFMSLEVEVQTAFMQHVQEHIMRIQVAQQQEAMDAMASGQPPQGPPPSSNEPTQRAGRGKGAPSDTKEKIFGRDMPPAE